MFKKVFAILLALLMLCSCNAEKPEEPAVPEISDIVEGEENLKESEEITGPEEEQETQINNGMELLA